MARNIVWFIMPVLMCSAPLAHAQGPAPYYPYGPMPYPNPGPYGYPGYSPPAPMNGPMGPMSMGPMSPGMPMGAMPPGMGPMSPGMPMGPMGPMPPGMGPMSPGMGPMGPGMFPMAQPGPMLPPGNNPMFPPPPTPFNPSGPGSGNPMFPPPPTPFNPSGPGAGNPMFPPPPTAVKPETNPNQPFPPPPTPVNPPGTAVTPPGSKAGPGEPYLLLPDQLPTSPPGAPPSSGSASGIAPGYPLPPADIQRTGYDVPETPPGPYVLYEGKRSQAELKLECEHVWLEASYLCCWLRRNVAPPLVTTGAINNPTAGTIGSPDTVVIAGGAIGDLEYSGIKLYGGAWLSDEHSLALEGGVFWLGQHGTSSDASSDGSFPLSRPVLDSAEHVVVVAAPGLASGNVLVQTTTDFFSAELNFAQNLYRCKGWSFDILCGFRYAYLHDALSIAQNSTALTPGSLFVPGIGSVSSLSSTDSFGVTNRFYGGQFGARLDWSWKNFDFCMTAKVAPGYTYETANIDGYSNVVFAGGATASLHQGVLNQASNIGQYDSKTFSVFSDMAFTFGYRITPHIRLLAGYDVMLWSRVQRAADQIDRNIADPAYPETRSYFWAQGITVGMEFRY